MGHLSPGHYVDNTAHQHAYLEMTQSVTLLGMVCLDYCLLKLDIQTLDGSVPPMPGYCTESVSGVQGKRFSVYGVPVFIHPHKEIVRF